MSSHYGPSHSLTFRLHRMALGYEQLAHSASDRGAVGLAGNWYAKASALREASELVRLFVEDLREEL